MVNPRIISLFKYYKIFRRYFVDYKTSKPYRVKLFNYQVGKNQTIEDHWLFQFIYKRGIITNNRKTLSIFSVNGDRIAIDMNLSDYKIFYTVENVHVPNSSWQRYEDLLLNKRSIKLSIGFDYIIHDKYFRLPYWIMANFKPDADYESIKKTCELLNKHEIDIKSRSKFCSFVCRNDYFGDREKIFSKINQVDRVDSDGMLKQ